MSDRFLIGSSFFFGASAFKREVFELWCENVEHVAKRASRTVLIYEGGTIPPFFPAWADAVQLSGDIGHVHDHIEGRKKHEFTGWSASMLALALLAYVDESDFVYVESDCFPFGPWIDRMYADLAPNGKIVFGPKMTAAPWMSCAQSLFLVKHDFLPTLVSYYLSLGKDGRVGNLGEDKFVKLEQRFGYAVRKLSFGVDRMRPIPWDEPVMYFQQPTAAELAEAKRRDLI